MTEKTSEAGRLVARSLSARMTVRNERRKHQLPRRDSSASLLSLEANRLKHAKSLSDFEPPHKILAQRQMDMHL